MLTAQDLAEAQADFARAYLTGLAAIYRAENGVADAYGGRTMRRSQVGSNIPCRAQQSRGVQSTEYGKQPATLGDWEVLLPVGTDVALADQIEIGQDVYEVQGSNAGRAELLILTAYCTRGGN